MHIEPRKFIFTINSGRSGSQYLAQLLATASDVCAFHEAEPNMSGPYLQMVQLQGLASTYTARSIKPQAIEQITANLPHGFVYAETNHMFIKTYFDVVMEHLKDHDINIVVLRRHLPTVLKSFINMGYFSDRNQVWPSWMHLPGTCESAFLPPPLGRNPDQYDLAIGYLIDIEARAQQFAGRYPDCGIHEVRLESLQQPADVETFFKDLHLQATPETWGMLGRSINQRTRRKAEINIGTTLDYCEERILDYLKICQETGVSVPSLPQLASL